MSATITTRAGTLPWLVRRSALLTVGALPAVIAVGGIGLLGIAPAVVAVILGQGGLAAVAMLPPAILLTGSARFAAVLVRGDRARVRDALRVDPGLAVLLAAPAAAAVLLLAAGGALRIVGDVATALLVLVVPLVAGYAAARGRSGIAAWRGGLVLLAYRPLWALTLAALSVIGAFAIAVSAGALALVVPPFLTLLGTAMCAVLLEEIDERQSR